MLLILLLWRSISDRVFIVCVENDVLSSNSVELKSVYVVSFRFVSIGCNL